MNVKWHGRPLLLQGTCKACKTITVNMVLLHGQFSKRWKGGNAKVVKFVQILMDPTLYKNCFGGCEVLPITIHTFILAAYAKYQVIYNVQNATIEQNWILMNTIELMIDLLMSSIYKMLDFDEITKVEPEDIYRMSILKNKCAPNTIYVPLNKIYDPNDYIFLGIVLYIHLCTLTLIVDNYMQLLYCDTIEVPLDEYMYTIGEFFGS